MATETTHLHADIQALTTLVAECRDEITQAIQTLQRLQTHDQETVIATGLNTILNLLTMPPPRQRYWWRVAGALLMAGVFGLAVGWGAQQAMTGALAACAQRATMAVGPAPSAQAVAVPPAQRRQR